MVCHRAPLPPASAPPTDQEVCPARIGRLREQRAALDGVVVVADLAGWWSVEIAQGDQHIARRRHAPARGTTRSRRGVLAEQRRAAIHSATASSAADE
jgi:hypothetical protein